MDVAKIIAQVIAGLVPILSGAVKALTFVVSGIKWLGESILGFVKSAIESIIRILPRGAAILAEVKEVEEKEARGEEARQSGRIERADTQAAAERRAREFLEQGVTDLRKAGKFLTPAGELTAPGRMVQEAIDRQFKARGGATRGAAAKRFLPPPRPKEMQPAFMAFDQAQKSLQIAAAGLDPYKQEMLDLARKTYQQAVLQYELEKAKREGPQANQVEPKGRVFKWPWEV